MTTTRQDDLILRLKAVPAKAFLRLPTEPLISAELLIGELCHEAATEIERLKQWQTVALAIGEREEERIKERELEEEEPGHG